MPPLDHLVGAVELPAFHGGAVAGGLYLAAAERARDWRADGKAISMGLRFLRPALATQEVEISVTIERLGTRMATLRCQAEQGGRSVVVGETVFWHP